MQFASQNDRTRRNGVLAAFYTKRKEGFISVNPQVLESTISQEELFRISEQLHELGLIEFKPLRGDDTIVAGVGRITAQGIDLIERDMATSRMEDSNPTVSDKVHASRPQVDVLLLTVTRVEARAVLDWVKQSYNREPVRHPIENKTYYDLGIIGGARVFMTRSEMGSGGPGGSTVTALESIQQLNPSAIIMVGIAFGVDQEKQHIGDVLVATRIFSYEQQRMGTSGDDRRDRIFRGDKVPATPWLVDRFRDGELFWDEASVRFGLVLSGNKLVDNLEFRNELLAQEPEALGGEMEGAGLFDAAYLRKVDWILIKAICDWADGRKSVNKHEKQKQAAQNAVYFVFFVLERGGFLELRQNTSKHHLPESNAGPQEIDKRVFNLPPDEFHELVVTLLRQKDGVGLREVIRVGVSTATSGLRKRIDKTSESRAQTVDANILFVLDRMTQLGSALIEHRVDTLWDDLLEGFLEIYRLVAPMRRNAQSPSDFEASLLISIVHRIYTLGAYATQLKQYTKVRSLILQRPTEDVEGYFSKVFWIRYVVTMAARGECESAFRGKSLIGPASDFVSTQPQFYNLFGADTDRTIKAMCQFDFLNCVLVAHETGDAANCYPNFGAYWNQRTIPIIRELVSNSELRQTLGPLSDGSLAQILQELDRLAAHIFISVNGWEEGQWGDARLVEFLTDFSRN